MLNIKKTLAKLLNCDLVVAEGTETVGGVTWTYRKWSSGIAECWTYFESTSASDGRWHINPVLPSFFNSTQIIVNVNYWSTASITTSTGYTRTNLEYSGNWSIDAYMINGAPSASAGAYVSCKGKWK